MLLLFSPPWPSQRLLTSAGATLLTLLSLTGAQDPWDQTSCASIGISKNTLQVDCLNFCSPFQAESFDGLNETDDIISQVMYCQCGGDDSGCLDSQVILDRTRPVPKCDDLGIGAITDCSPLCFELGIPLGGFRDVNGKTSCSCGENGDTDICTDDPNCAQLRIYPGTAIADCENFCGPDTMATATDEVEFAGGMFVANKDQTHLKVSCMCGPFPQCQDSILFSDLARLESCQEDLNIFVENHCQAYCDSFGFTEDAEFYSEGFFRNCTCVSAEGMALACEDDPNNPGIGPSDSEDGDGDGSGDGEGSSGSGPSLLQMAFFNIGFVVSSAVMVALRS